MPTTDTIHLGRYQILEEVDSGAVGVVYRARDEISSRVVALKVLRQGARSPKTLSRFEREAEILSRLHHPRIVRFVDRGTEEGRPFFAMEFLRGETLFDRIARGPMRPVEAAKILWMIARSVDYVHSRGVFHRDLKPSNIILSDRGPVLIDFGVALARREDEAADPIMTPALAESSRMTATGELLGTPSYMAPEQIKGTGKLADRRTDVYGIGAVFYEMLTGRTPFTAMSFAELSLRTLHDEPEAPPAYAGVCLRCLEKEPTRRYPTAEAVADALAVAHRQLRAAA